MAAITLPVLVSHIQDMQYKVAAKKAYSEAGQVLQLMIDEGHDISYYKNNGSSFYTPFSKYFNVNCLGAVNCNFNPLDIVVNQKYNYRTFNKKRNFSYTNFDDGMFITTDGRVWFFENPSTAGANRVYITVDVNGVAKPNVMGRDVFMFWIDDKNSLKPMGSDGSRFLASTTCTKSENIHGGAGCMYYVMNNISY